jgi:hypothetical protein
VRPRARLITSCALALLCGASALALAPLAVSQEDGPTPLENPVGAVAQGELSATPGEGPTGTRIAVAGADCTLPGTTLSADAVLATLATPDGMVVFQAQLAVEADGTWQGELAAPAGTPSGELQVTAACVAPEQDIRHYGPATHTVTGEGAAAATAALPPTSTVDAPDPSLAAGAASTHAASSSVAASGDVSGAAGLPAFHNPGAPIEPLPAYDGQSTCSATDKPGTQRFRDILRGVFPTGLGSISRACTSGGQSEHKEGRAYDWPIDAFNSTQHSYATQTVDWLLATDSRGNAYANARRLGVMYIIYNRAIFKLYRPELGWQSYTGSSPHTDHVHYSLTRAGGAGTTSWWTAPADPCGGQTHQPFCDVSPSHQFRSAILWVADEGIADGWPDTSFRPLLPVSRQAMAAFMYRLAGPSSSTPPATPTFSDVSRTHQFRTEIEWLAAEEIATGYADGRFLPLSSVSRQAMAAFMFRAAGAPSAYRAPTSSSFRDVAVGRPFYREIHWLASESITTGYTDGTFRPDAKVSRQAMAAFLQRLDHLV